MAAVPPREFHFSLVWIKADGSNTAGTMSLVEIMALAGWETPMYVHHAHDEYFCMLDGTVTDQAGEAREMLASGAFAFGPSGNGVCALSDFSLTRLSWQARYPAARGSPFDADHSDTGPLCTLVHTLNLSHSIDGPGHVV